MFLITHILLQSKSIIGFTKDGALTVTLMIVINLISTTLDSLLSMLVRMILVNMSYESLNCSGMEVMMLSVINKQMNI